MGMNLEDVLAQANQRSNVYITIVSNQDTGLVSYASGSVTLHPATGVMPPML